MECENTDSDMGSRIKMKETLKVCSASWLWWMGENNGLIIYQQKLAFKERMGELHLFIPIQCKNKTEHEKLKKKTLQCWESERKTECWKYSAS